MGNKGDVIAYLSERVRYALVPKFLLLSYGDWMNERSQSLSTITSTLPDKEIIVRSCASSEDIELARTIGRFRSIVWHPEQTDTLVTAIDEVFTSIVQVEGISGFHRVIIQEYVNTTIFHGVAISCRPQLDSPYYLINIAPSYKGSTDLVTGGTAIPRKIYINKAIGESVLQSKGAVWKNLVNSLLELESFFPGSPLDVEFGYDANGVVYLFQVRAAGQVNPCKPDKTNVKSVQLNLEHAIETKILPRAALDACDLSNMADWNPAEMIGDNPPALPYSLYKSLITDGIWKSARVAMGYNRTVEECLMLNICNHPYIDVRASLASFVPEQLSLVHKEVLVEAGLQYLRKNKALHDKIEFEVAVTGFTFFYNERLARLGVYDPALLNVLRKGHIDILAKAPSHLEAASSGIKKFDGLLRNNKEKLHLTQLLALAQKAAFHFAVAARCAFLAESLLRDFERANLFSEAMSESFKCSLETIEKQMLNRFSIARTNRSEFLFFIERYGHLRPGTYDVRKPSMRELSMTEMELFPCMRNFPTPPNTFFLPAVLKKAINDRLKAEGVPHTADTLIRFMKESIAMREFGKFVYSAFVSEILEKIRNLGNQHQLCLEDMPHLSITEWLGINDQPGSSFFRDCIEKNRERWAIGERIALPSFIGGLNDLFFIEDETPKPNFITTQTVTGRTYVVKDFNLANEPMYQRIILIERADPGFDILFLHEIAGIITKYGGSNSHLALRCVELGIPAAIGCGSLFDELIKYDYLNLDCSEKRIYYDHRNFQPN